MRKDLVDPNTVEVPHQEAYTVEDLERRSPSLNSPRPPPITEEGDASYPYEVKDISKDSVVGTRVVAATKRLEERPLDAKVDKGKIPIEKEKHIIEEETTSGALNFPHESDDDDEEYIYIPKELLEGKGVKAPRAPTSDITYEEIKGIFPRKLMVESCDASVDDGKFIKSMDSKKLLWKHLRKKSVDRMGEKR